MNLVLLVFALLLGATSLGFSAFFSGSETGLYKASRLRLKLDAMDGDRTARRLLAFVNHPTLFVATVLVGNNLANYLLSFATVLAVSAIAMDEPSLARDVAATLVVTPFFFLYGELFPKHMFLLAPDRLLRRCTPMLLVCAVIFLPISLCLWLFNAVISRVLGRSHEQVKLRLAKAELTRTFDDGETAGILHRTQRELIERVLTISSQQTPIRRWVTPPTAFPFLTTNTDTAAALQALHGTTHDAIPVYESETRMKPVGYVVYRELLTQRDTHTPLPLHPCADITTDLSPLAVASLLVRSRSALGCLVDAAGRCSGIIAYRQVVKSLGDAKEALSAR